MANAHHPDSPPTDAHPAHLQHHFATSAQQFESVALGMWLFLATEILLFGGLFCAYAVYRANHPEIFEYAHVYLDKFWGGLNTCVLICSSFTMAVAVWAAQHGRTKLLPAMLALTFVMGCAFLGVKYIEYKHKWEEGLLWGKYYQPRVEPQAHSPADAQTARAAENAPATKPQTAATKPQAATTSAPAGVAAGAPPAVGSTSASSALATSAAPATTSSASDAPSPTFLPPELGPAGLRPPGSPPDVLQLPQRPHNVQTFFAIYFLLTGLHAVHVIAGLTVITWLLVRALKGQFGAAYFTPVAMGGLYWHVVDIIWIYLFPLLYLIR